MRLEGHWEGESSPYWRWGASTKLTGRSNSMKAQSRRGLVDVQTAEASVAGAACRGERRGDREGRERCVRWSRTWEAV